MPSLYLNKTPPATPWLSPALIIRKVGLADLDGGTPLLDVQPSTNPQRLQVAQATAGNDTANAITGVRVQLWALAFGTGAVPNLFLESLGGTRGVKIPAGGSGTTLNAGLEQPFEQPWDATNGLTSTAPEIVARFVNGEVHCCLYGNVYAPGDGAEIPESQTGPVLDPAGNRHHAQRNMTIKKQPPGFAMKFQLYAANPDAKADQLATLQIAERSPRELQPWELGELDALAPWIRRTRTVHDGGIRGVEVVVDGKPRPLRLAHRPLDDLELDVEGGGAGRRRRVELGAHESRAMTLNATVPDEEFVLRVIDVRQTQRERVTGGARVLLLSVPDELIARPGKRA